MGFEVISKLPETMYPGLMIEYRVRPLMNIPVSWLTEITRLDAPSYFVDEQRHGPYSIWHHEHFFTPTADGKVLMRDLVHYMLPFSPLGDWMHPWLVRPRLNAIFHFRRTAVEKLFPVKG